MRVYILTEYEEGVGHETLQVFGNEIQALDARYDLEQDNAAQENGLTYHVFEWEVS